MEMSKTLCIMNFLVMLLILCNFAVANGADLRCYEESFNRYLIFSLNDPTPFLNSTAYRSERKTVIKVFGFDGKADGQSNQAIVGVYLGRANICLLNWEEEASKGILGLLAYPMTAIPNAIKIGIQFGQTMIKLCYAGLDLSKVHLIGFSLGAQLTGYTGRVVKDKGKIIGRITGLDPAGPFYDGTLSLLGLSASDAEFVGIIHTNPGMLGSNEATGTVDIWANCGSSVQPGCEAAGISGFFMQNLCSHDRSWRYFAEAIERPTAFEASSATDCDTWRAGTGTNERIYLGDNNVTHAHGNFYLRTDSVPPYRI